MWGHGHDIPRWSDTVRSLAAYAVPNRLITGKEQSYTIKVTPSPTERRSQYIDTIGYHGMKREGHRELPSERPPSSHTSPAIGPMDRLWPPCLVGVIIRTLIWVPPFRAEFLRSSQQFLGGLIVLAFYGLKLPLMLVCVYVWFSARDTAHEKREGILLELLIPLSLNGWHTEFHNGELLRELLW
jgi:hypothetical protein